MVKKYLEYGSASLLIPPTMIGYDKQHHQKLFNTITKGGNLAHHDGKAAIYLVKRQPGKNSIKVSNKGTITTRVSKRGLKQLNTKLAADSMAGNMMDNLFSPSVVLDSAIPSYQGAKRGRKLRSAEEKQAIRDKKDEAKAAKKEAKLAKRDAKLADKEAKKTAKAVKAAVAADKKKSPAKRRGRPSKV